MSEASRCQLSHHLAFTKNATVSHCVTQRARICNDRGPKRACSQVATGTLTPRASTPCWGRAPLLQYPGPLPIPAFPWPPAHPVGYAFCNSSNLAPGSCCSFSSLGALPQTIPATPAPPPRNRNTNLSSYQNCKYAAVILRSPFPVKLISFLHPPPVATGGCQIINTATVIHQLAIP